MARELLVHLNTDGDQSLRDLNCEAIDQSLRDLKAPNRTRTNWWSDDEDTYDADKIEDVYNEQARTADVLKRNQTLGTHSDDEDKYFYEKDEYDVENMYKLNHAVGNLNSQYKYSYLDPEFSKEEDSQNIPLFGGKLDLFDSLRVSNSNEFLRDETSENPYQNVSPPEDTPELNDVFAPSPFANMKSNIQISIDPGESFDAQNHLLQKTVPVYRTPVCLLIGQRGVGKTTLYNNLIKTYSNTLTVDRGECAISNQMSLSLLRCSNTGTNLSFNTSKAIDILLVDKDGQDLNQTMKEFAVFISDIVILVIDVMNDSYSDIWNMTHILKRDNMPFIIVINKIDSASAEALMDQIDDIKRVIADHGMSCEVPSFVGHGAHKELTISLDVRSIPILPISCLDSETTSHKLVKVIETFAQNRLYNVLLQSDVVEGVVLNVQIRKELDASKQAVALMILNGILSVSDHILINVNNEACIMYIRKIWACDESGLMKSVESTSGTNVFLIQTDEDVDLLTAKIELESNIKLINSHKLNKTRQLYRDIRHCSNKCVFAGGKYDIPCTVAPNLGAPPGLSDVPLTPIHSPLPRTPTPPPHSPTTHSPSAQTKSSPVPPKARSPSDKTKGYRGVFLKAPTLNLLKALYSFIDLYDLPVIESGLDTVTIEDLNDIQYPDQLKAIIALGVDVSPLVIDYIKNTDIHILEGRTIGELQYRIDAWI